MRENIEQDKSMKGLTCFVKKFELYLKAEGDKENVLLLNSCLIKINNNKGTPLIYIPSERG